MDNRNNVDAHEKRNTALLNQFRERGVSLVDDRSIELHFWAWGQPKAAALGYELYKRGFMVLRLAPSSDDRERWSIDAGAKLSIQDVVNRAFVSDLVALANRLNGEFDGWGTSV